MRGASYAAPDEVANAYSHLDDALDRAISEARIVGGVVPHRQGR
ncbi:hypothetical protein [Trinickia sp.]